MKKKMLFGVLGAGVLAASIVLAAMPANAASLAASTPKSPVASVTYSDLNIVEFLLFGRGPIAKDEPEMLTRLAITPQPGISEETMKVVLADLESVDADFHNRVTVNAQAGDPYKAQEALDNFNSDAIAFANKYKASQSGSALSVKSDAAANGQVWAFADYVVSTAVFLTAAVAVSVIAVAGALAVFAYQHPNTASDLEAQNFASALSGL